MAVHILISVVWFGLLVVVGEYFASPSPYCFGVVVGGLAMLGREVIRERWGL